MCPELPAEISSSLAPLMSGMMRLLLDLKAQVGRGSAGAGAALAAHGRLRFLSML